MATPNKRKKKLPFGISEEFITQLNSQPPTEIKELIVNMQERIRESQDFLKTNEGVQELKDKLDQVAGPTRDAVKLLKNRTKYALDRLRDVGAFDLTEESK